MKVGDLVRWTNSGHESLGMTLEEWFHAHELEAID